MVQRNNIQKGVYVMKRKVFAVLLAFCCISSIFLLQLGNKPAPAQAASWDLVWSDEFNGTAGSGVNTSNWLYDQGTGYGCSACPANWGTGEVEVMTNSTRNVYQDGAGHLAIKPIRESNGTWTSGRIETQRTDFAAPAGGMLAVEGSIQLPNVTGAGAAGYWPAFWMLGAPFRGNYLNWPSVGEIDIMENVNGLNTTWGTFHCGYYGGGPCNEPNGIGGQRNCSPTTCQASFHTYRIEYDRSVSPEVIRWYQDGVLFWQVEQNRSGMDDTTWRNALNHGFFIILNVAMGGGFPGAFGGGPTGSTVSGAPMLVDYVRVYTSKGSASTPTPPPSNCTDFKYGVDKTGSTTARPWFQPCGWTAGYVILHYTRPGLSQQNVYMNYNSGAGRWEYDVSSLSSGQTLQYSFTYQRNGLQYDTGWSSWTQS